MKPVNNVQREILRLSRSLAPLSIKRRLEALKKSADRNVTSRGSWCSVCGHVFQGEDEVCPNCGARFDRVTKKSANARVSKRRYYFTVVTVCRGWQVVRAFVIERETRKGRSMTDEELMNENVLEEVYQAWIDESGTPHAIARTVLYTGYYIDLWNLSSPMEIRRWNGDRYTIGGYMAKGARLIPMVKKHGLKKLVDSASEVAQILGVLRDSKSETLVKNGYMNMFVRSVGWRRGDVRAYWRSIKVAMRHGYRQMDDDPQMWFDHLQLLNHTGRDVLNPKFICPADLKQAHDELVEEQNRIRRREEEQRRKQLELEQAELLCEDSEMNRRYRRKFKAVLGVQVEEGEIHLQMLQDVRDFFDEWQALHHCVFTNHYYDVKEHPRSIIIGAKVRGERTETIELDSKTMEVVQCRGSHNGQSVYHTEILDLMNRNIHKFIPRKTA